MGTTSVPGLDLELLFERAAGQYRGLLAELGTAGLLPRSADISGLRRVPPTDWTSGFFPGSLWLLLEACGQKEWQVAAERYTALVQPQHSNRSTHDIGFMINCSVGQGWRLRPTAAYREALIDAGRSLASRFDPVVGCIRSWDEHRWEFPVIIDNLMNLELLFRTSEETRDPSFREMAERHADQTLWNHFRPDGSCYHVVAFDRSHGRVVEHATHQGLSATSTWARGQAWAAYGFTLCYRYTRNPRYRAAAERSARYMLAHPRMPADLVPYWDYDDPRIPDAPRDASSAAVLASALLELAGDGRETEVEFRTAAENILHHLASPAYLSSPGANGGFLLGHSTGSVPHRGEIDAPLVYADYYFLEALLRLRRLRSGVAVA